MSPKNKGKLGKARTEAASAIAQPDEFVSSMGKVMQTLRPHASRIAFLIAALALVLVGYAGWTWYGHRKEARATELYERAVLLSQTPIEAPDGDHAKAGKTSVTAPELKDDDLRQLPKSYISEAARAQAVLDTLDQIDGDYGSTDVAKEAKLLKAGVTLALGRYDEAAGLYGAYADHAEAAELKVAAREGVGYALEAKAMAEKDAGARERGLEQALQAFETMQPKADAPGYDEARFHQGRILMTLGKRDDAAKMFQALLDGKPDPVLKGELENRLAALGAQAKK